VVAALVLAIVAPLGILATLSVQRAWRRQLANVDRQNAATARAISVAVDQQIERTTSALDVLGELHALDAPELPAFENLASRILPYQPNWTAILLANADGAVIDGVPDRRDGGATLNGVNWARAAFDRRSLAVSNVFTLPNEPGHFLMVALPVVRDGRPILVLGARLKTDGLVDTLRRQQIPANGAVNIVDSDNRMVARTRQPELVGTPAMPVYIEQLRRASEGSFRAVARDGTPTFAAFSRSERTGLSVAVALPAEEVNGPIRRILLMLVGAWAVVLTLGAGLGLLLGQIIVRAMSRASQAAMALAQGEPVSPPGSRIREIDELAVSLRRASATLEERNRERDEASRLKDEFLMTISHELRTPLTAICGWARMLASGQIREPQHPRAVEAIERNALALQQLVDDLLDVSRIVAGKLRLDVQSVLVPELVASAAEAIRPAAMAKNIQVVTSVDPDCGAISGDPGRLQQLVWNLLSNSVKFTPTGGRISIHCGRSGDGIELVFTDTGVGIDQQFLPFVFERFRQGASGTTRAHGGLGLGLSIVRDLVELHGGTVTAANNTPAPGATFRVLLPVAPGLMYSAVAEGRPYATSASSTTPPTHAAH
jgi:signal transduction histidine kinase